MCDFTTGELCDNEQSFVEPKGTMHITEGNGGVPGVGPAFAVKSCRSAPGRVLLGCRISAPGSGGWQVPWQ